jgi:hypothetical protein
VLKDGGTNRQRDTISAFIAEHNEAESLRAERFGEVPESLKELALELTAPYENDLQKAAALEAFFHKGDFVYDLTYTSSRNNNSVVYFVFESKRGTCSDFATAFSLLARGAGLTVRYVEGFVTRESERPGYYEITTETAHAYPEVYIPGAGWTVFEPTVPDLTGGSGGAGEGADIGTATVAATIVSAVIVLSAMLTALLLRPVLSEAVFRFRVRLTKGSGAVIMLHARHSSQIGKLFSVDTNPLTAEQTAACAKRLTGADSSDLRNAFTKACYGGAQITEAELGAAFECYKAQRKLLKERRRADKKKRVYKLTDYAQF